MPVRKVNGRWTAEERPAIGRFLRFYHTSICKTLDNIGPARASDPTGALQANYDYYDHARRYIEFMAWQVGIRLKRGTPCQADSKDTSGGS